MWGVQEMGIVPFSCLVDWLITVEGGRRKEVLRWWWCGIVEWSVVWVQKKIRCDGLLLLLLLLCSEWMNERCIHVMLYSLSFSDLIRGDE